MRQTFILFFIFSYASLSCNDKQVHGIVSNEAKSHYIRVVQGKDTVLFEKIASEKETIYSENYLDRSCTLYSGMTLNLNTAPVPTKDGYLKVDFSMPVPGCEIASGYVLESDVESSLPKVDAMSKNERAFLSTIAYAEGTGDTYNYIFSHASFSSYEDHPRQRKCSNGLCSNAAGRYQFLAGTWDPLARKAGVKDFTPASQDMVCLALIKEVDATQDVMASNQYASFERAIYSLSGKWASLPGAPYGQPTKSMSDLWRFYQSQL
ncbi:MAG: glycoside hydrolase family 104 protein [Pseudomonadota bacterium]